MLENFLDYIQKNNLWKTEDKILVAVSGGIDSVVMADLFSKTNYRFALVHCNFQLRGKDSLLDEQFVRSLAENYQVPIFVKNFDTQNFASEEGLSTQMAARQLRYLWFDQLLGASKYQYLAVAHHLNDALETVLFNLTKGTGIAGLHGILPKVGTVVRPLLFASREQIFNYLENNQLKWREDSSNSSIKYHRNLIRHEVVPVLEKINPGLLQTFQGTLERIRGAENLANYFIQEFKDEATCWKGNTFLIHTEKLLKTPEPKLVLYETIRDFGFNYHQTKDVLTCLTIKNQQSVGDIFLAEQFQLNIDREYLIIAKKISEGGEPSEITATDTEFTQNDFSLRFEKIPIDNHNLSREPAVADLDFDSLSFPLRLRRWKAGDKFFPLGMKNRKKISDFLIDQKISITEKDHTFVLTSGNEIVWLVGLRPDNRFKVTSETKTVYRINLNLHA